MRAALALSPTSRARRVTRSSRTALRCCSTLSIAAPWAPIRYAGDGAGILVQIPHAFFKAEAERLGFRAASRWRLWRWPAVHAPGRAAPCALRGYRGQGACRGAYSADRLARRAGKQPRPARKRPLRRALPPAALRRQAGVHPGRVPLRAGALRGAARHFEPRHRGSWQQGRQFLSGFAVLPHRRLQGHVPVLSSLANTIATCTILASNPRWRSCISASRPTPSRPGGSRIPTG